MSNFNSKTFNGEVFGKYVNQIPNLKRNELVHSGALRLRPELKDMFSEQSGGFYGTVPMFATIGGDALNYDGSTDITANETSTFSQSMVVVGRAKAWVENDFSADVAGTDFMDNVAVQVAQYWDETDQKTILAILKGVFAMTGDANEEFVNGHTLDISAEAGDGAKVAATTLNTAIQKACGDNKDKFSLVFMHSAVATNLENLNLIDRLKYTDENGIQRDLTLGTWCGRTVFIDDTMPVVVDGDNITYTTYILGDGAFDYVDVGASVPYAMDRDEAKNGGRTTLYSRQRKIFAPYGINFTKSDMATLSPTDAELESAANWELVKNAEGTAAIDHKAIPIARIISRG
ncbi:MAG: phage coat protein [Clostridia bacterium]|nr:phage coat protein [Clostridia bacterium]